MQLGSKALGSPQATSAATLASAVALCAKAGPNVRSPIAKTFFVARRCASTFT